MRYFENNGQYSELEKKVFLHLKGSASWWILEIIAKSPEVSRKEIAKTMGIAGPSIFRHTRHLSGDRVIMIRKNGELFGVRSARQGVDIFWRNFAEAGREEYRK